MLVTLRLHTKVTIAFYKIKEFRMGVKKFTRDVANSLGLNNLVVSSKKKSLKDLIKKLKKRRLENFASLREVSNHINYIELQEEIDIISVQIKKAEKILNKLSDNKK